MGDLVGFQSPERKRVARACDRCKLRKSKCDGRAPCQPCAANDLDCTYDHPIRRLTSAMYLGYLEKKVRDLESLLSDSARQSQSGIDDREFSQLRRSYSGSGRLEDAAEPDNYRFPSLSDSSGRPSVSEDDMLPTMIDSKHNSSKDWESLPGYRGHFAGLNILQRIRSLCSQLAGDQDTDPMDASDDDLADAFDCISASCVPMDPLDVLAILPSKEVTLARIRTALNEACCIMQFMHRSTVESLVHHMYEKEPDVYSKEDRKHLALLYSLSALGIQFQTDTTEDTQNGNPQPRGLRYFRTSRKLLDITDCHDLIALQTVMCMVLYLQASSMLSSSYSYICAAVAASIRMGLHTSAASEGLEANERHVRRRIFSVLNMMDTYVTTALGLPRTLRDVGSDHLLPIATESIPSESDITFFDNPPSLVMATHAHAKLVMIMAQTVQLNHPVTRPPYNTNDYYAIPYRHIADIEGQLDAWLQNLPSISSPGQPEDVNLLRSQLLLRLAYGHVQMVLYRPFLHHVIKNVPGRILHFKSYACGSACVKAAMQVVWLVEALHSRRLVNVAHWFTVYILSFATTSLFLFVLSNQNDPTIAETTEAAKKGREILASFAERSPAARRCLMSLQELDPMSSNSDRVMDDQAIIKGGFVYDEHMNPMGSSQSSEAAGEAAGIGSGMHDDGQSSQSSDIQAMMYPRLHPYMDSL